MHIINNNNDNDNDKIKINERLIEFLVKQTNNESNKFTLAYTARLLFSICIYFMCPSM